jgi:hypothetical protein
MNLSELITTICYYFTDGETPVHKNPQKLITHFIIFQNLLITSEEHVFLVLNGLIQWGHYRLLAGRCWLES